MTLDDRIAVLAAGSNASPIRLAEKCGEDAVIPVARIAADDTAIVYSAHISRYGSIPATRIHHPGSRSFVHVPLLDPDQLAAVDATEGSYEREPLDGYYPAFLGQVWVYQSWRGLLRPAGEPIRVSEVPAKSDLLAAGQLDALTIVAAMTGAAPDGETLSQMVASGSVDAEDINRLLE